MPNKSSALKEFLQIACQSLGVVWIVLLGDMLPAPGAVGKQQPNVLAYTLRHWPNTEMHIALSVSAVASAVILNIAACFLGSKGKGFSV